MVEKIFKCEDCKTTGAYSSKKKARNMGWAVARDNKTCYCPTCAFKHRSTGCKGAKPKVIVGQLKIAE